MSSVSFSPHQFARTCCRLQSTADLLSTTQSRLSTGKKVNSALDNPTNFFTAQSLDNRASDINNLLDGIGNGVQVLQAANTGITSLQKLVDQRQVNRSAGFAGSGRLFFEIDCHFVCGRLVALRHNLTDLVDHVSFVTGTTLTVGCSFGGNIPAVSFTFTVTSIFAGSS